MSEIARPKLRALAVLVLTLLTACTPLVDRNAKEPPPPHRAAVTADDLLVTRVAAARAAVRGSQLRFGVAPLDSCVVVHRLRDTWLFDCASREIGTGGHVYVQREGGAGPSIAWTFDDVVVGRRIDRRLGAYSEGSFIVVPDFETFGARYAELEPNVEIWLGMFVHEAFHVVQSSRPEVERARRACRTAAGIVEASDLSAFYAEHAAFRVAVDLEIDVLARALLRPSIDADDARRTLRDWKTVHDFRRAAFDGAVRAEFAGRDFWASEGYFVFLEGLARYVEVGFLREPPAEVAMTLHGSRGFEDFRETRGRAVPRVWRFSDPKRGYFYVLGMYLAFVLEVVAPGSWREELWKRPGLLVEEALAAAAN